METGQVSTDEVRVGGEADCAFDIDEEFFSDNSYASTKSEFSSPISPVSPRTPPSSTSSPISCHDFTLPIRRSPVYIHAQCGHPFQPPNFPGILVGFLESTNMLKAIESSNLITSKSHTYIMHPRSCLLCTWHEEQRIVASTNYACDLIEDSAIAEEYKDRAIAYQIGLESGRLLALRKSLGWCHAKGSRGRGEVAWAMKALLEGLKSNKTPRASWKCNEKIRGDDHGRLKGRSGGLKQGTSIEELVALIEESTLRYCEAEYELRLSDDLEEIEYLGKKDGIGLQARMDEKAIKHRLC